MATTKPKSKAPTKSDKGRVQMNKNIEMAKKLALVLSDTYVLAVKVHGYHWNVMGPGFASLHNFFGEHYETLVKAADDIAERIRTLGLMPDGSMDAFLQNTVIKEAGVKPITSKAMLKDLYDSHQAISERLIEAEELADEIDDIVTQDMMTGRLAAHQKIMWMIRSHLA